MAGFPLAHIDWAVTDNDARHGCDAFFMDVFGAESAFEILLTPELFNSGLDREERLMMIGDTMIIPIAAAGPGESPGSPIGEMLRRNAGPNRWLGVALYSPDLPAMDAWLSAKGFKLHYDPGMESHYFLISRKQALGLRIEIMSHAPPGDPRVESGWNPQRWRDEHPLGTEGLQSIGVSAPTLEAARDVFANRLEWPEIGNRRIAIDEAECVSFLMGDTVIEAMQPTNPDSPLARHVEDVQGIYCLTFKTRSARDAAAYLQGRGLSIVGDVSSRFAIAPDQAFGRLIYFTEETIPGYPQLGNRMSEAAQAPALA
jgi:hypothetical protein